MAITYTDLIESPFLTGSVPATIDGVFVRLTAGDGTSPDVDQFVTVTPGGTLQAVPGNGGSIEVVDSVLGVVASLAGDLVAASVSADLPDFPVVISDLEPATESSTLPELPITFVMASNDTFVWTPEGGSTEIFTIAPAVVTTAAELVTAISTATGALSSEAFSTYVTVTHDSTHLILTAVTAGTALNGSTITPGATDATDDIGWANPTTLDGGTDPNDEFVFTSGGGGGDPETFTIAPDSYADKTTLVAALMAATGDDDTFGDYVSVTAPSTSYVFTMSPALGTADNGNTITAGSDDALATLGITPPLTFAGGAGDSSGPAAQAAFWYA